MKRILNQRGNIAIALALAVVGIMSGITLVNLSFGDTMAARYDFDAIQELHFLRSEAVRGLRLTQVLDYSGEGFYLPIKYAEVVGSHTKNTYKLASRIVREDVSTGGGLYFATGFTIRTLATAKRGIGVLAQWGSNESVVRRYAEKAIRRTSFAGYHYFSDTDQSMNRTPVYFWGPDEVYGKVHSNSDIWLKRVGGGNNGGWPTFFGTVSTCGTIRSHSGTPPYNQIFRAGYWEHVNPLEFNATAAEIRARGRIVGPPQYDSKRIIFVTVADRSYSTKIATVTNRRDTANVWTQYPPETNPWLFLNQFSSTDTTWITGPSGNLSNASALVLSKMWLRGRFQGRQTWAAQDTIFLNDDCYYSGTPRGQAPDGAVIMPGGNIQYTGPINLEDFLGIVSEKSIVIQYGFKDPADSVRKKPNCDGDQQGIWIYAAMCALGKGEITQRDGMFTFEYQHPHGSTPDYRIGNRIFRKIDIHRFRYEQSTIVHGWPTVGHPQYNYNLDYPWYNPLWPERMPFRERGTIHLYGSVAQRRRGYVHRNLSDSDYPNHNNKWQIPLDYCGGPVSGSLFTIPPLTNVQLGTVNAPGASGSGVGYNKKDYHFDNRFTFTQPPDFPEVHVKGGLTPFESETWIFKKPPSSL